MTIDTTLEQEGWYYTEESNGNVFWMTWMDWVYDSTQWFLNVHINLEKWKNIENCSKNYSEKM